MHRRDLLHPGMLVFAGVVLGTALGTSVMPVLFRQDLPSSWVEFLGSILGGLLSGIVTVLAAMIAIVPSMRQAAEARKQAAGVGIEVASNQIREMAQELTMIRKLDAASDRIVLVCHTGLSERPVNIAKIRSDLSEIFSETAQLQQQLMDATHDWRSDGVLKKHAEDVKFSIVRIADIMKAQGANITMMSSLIDQVLRPLRDSKFMRTIKPFHSELERDIELWRDRIAVYRAVLRDEVGHG